MKGARLVIFMSLLFLVLCASAYARPPIQDQDPESEIVYAASGSTVRCWDDLGCPMCEANIAKTMSVCVRVRYTYGYCVCSNPRPMPDPRTVVCTTKGYCSFQ